MTATGNPSYRWMETLLTLLFSRYERPDALALLRDVEAQQRAFADLGADLEAAGMPSTMLTSTEGQNLFVAVLALRIKFPVDEALQKVALNIAMRDARTSH